MSEAISPENNKELHLRAVAELAVIRILLTALCRQCPDPQRLLSDFEQAAEEQRGFVELSGARDERFEHFVALYSKSIVVAGDIPPPAAG